MSRTRMIKPGFFKHGDLFDLEEETGLPIRVAFAGLWTVADRAGRFKWRPRELKLEVLPFDQVDFTEVLAALERGGFIRSYEAGGQCYGVIPTFAEHQSFHLREAASTLPAPPWEDPEQSPEQDPAPAKAVPSTNQGTNQGSAKHRARTNPAPAKAVSSRPASTSTSASTSASASARTTTTATTARAREELVEQLPAAYEPDLAGLLERIPAQNHLSWLRSLLALTSGLHPPGAGLPNAVPPAVLGEAVRQFNTNGETNWKRFTGYVRAVLTPRPDPAGGGSGGGSGPRGPSTKTERAAAAGRTTYETAMAVLGGHEPRGASAAAPAVGVPAVGVHP